MTLRIDIPTNQPAPGLPFFFHVHLPFLLDDILILVCIFWHLEDQQSTFVDDMKINHDAATMATMRSINLELSVVRGG